MAERRNKIGKGLKVLTLNQMLSRLPMLISDLCDYSHAYIVVKGNITVTNPDNAKKIKQWHLKTMHHSSIAFQKLIT